MQGGRGQCESRDLSYTCCPIGVDQGPGTEQHSHPFPRQQADTGAKGLFYLRELDNLYDCHDLTRYKLL